MGVLIAYVGGIYADADDSMCGKVLRNPGILFWNKSLVSPQSGQMKKVLWGSSLHSWGPPSVMSSNNKEWCW